MILFIDGQAYHVNLKKVGDHLSSFYVEKSREMQVLDMGDGKKLDFGRKSLVRTAMKAAMVPFIVPVIGMIYKLRGLDPPKHEKHEDLIDWMVLKMIEFGGIIEGDIQLHADSETIGDDNTGDGRRIITISTVGTDIFNRRRLTVQQQSEPAQIGEQATATERPESP